MSFWLVDPYFRNLLIKIHNTRNCHSMGKWCHRQSFFNLLFSWTIIYSRKANKSTVNIINMSSVEKEGQSSPTDFSSSVSFSPLKFEKIIFEPSSKFVNWGRLSSTHIAISWAFQEILSRNTSGINRSSRDNEEADYQICLENTPVVMQIYLLELLIILFEFLHFFESLSNNNRVTSLQLPIKILAPWSRRRSHPERSKKIQMENTKNSAENT